MTSLNHRRGWDRHQTLLLPERLEDYIAADNPVRFLDAFAASLDLRALGFAKATVQDTGRPPYDPADLLRLYLYGYLQRVRSSRLLEAECHRNLEGLWLLGKLAPDHKTIADFRKDNRQALQGVTRQFTLLCQKLERFGGPLAGIDGPKLCAVNRKDANFNEKKLPELLARADARSAEYLAQLDQADRAEPPNPAPAKAALEAKLAALREKKEWPEALRGQLDEADKPISVTDPDARKLRTRNGFVVGFNAQTAVDAKHKLIAAAAGTHEETDGPQLANVARQTQENLGVAKLEVVVDKGCYRNTEVSRCLARGLTPYLEKADPSANTKQGLSGKSKFHYDAAKAVYVCPAGKELTPRFNTEAKGRPLRYDRAVDCRNCALKQQGPRNQANRTITREEDEGLLEARAARVAAQPEKMQLRKPRCEHPFGTIKRWFGYSYFLVKGLAKVRCEWHLMTLAYNLKRGLNLVKLSRN
jgi:transposase